MSDALIRYYDLRLLRTIDLNFLFEILAAEIPNLTEITLEPMDENERAASSKTDENGIIIVQKRIHLHIGDGGTIQRLDLEAAIERGSP